MKTETYLRVSIVIPFLVWIICLLFYMLISMSPINELVYSKSTTITDLFLLLFAFYVIGTIIWIFPYLLLSIILFLWSFIGQARVIIKVFALSPIAMTISTISAVNILTLGTTGDSTFFSNSASNFQDFASFNGLLAVAILLWGYICVGIGFGVYKLLQYLHLIKEEASIEIRHITMMKEAV